MKWGDVVGIGDLALGAAPIAGGALLAALAGSLKGTDHRASIKDDLELLEKIPPEKAELRAGLERTIDDRIQDLITSMNKSRDLRQSALGYRGDWRAFVVFICALLFTTVWWNVDHQRDNWIVFLVVLIVMTTVTGLYAARSFFRALRRPLGRLRGGSPG